MALGCAVGAEAAGEEPVKIQVKEIAWLAGLMEGEGSFFLSQNQPKMALLMSDEDIVSRAALLLGTTHRGPY